MCTVEYEPPWQTGKNTVDHGKYPLTMQLIVFHLQSDVLCSNLAALSFLLLQQTLHKTSNTTC